MTNAGHKGRAVFVRHNTPTSMYEDAGLRFQLTRPYGLAGDHAEPLLSDFTKLDIRDEIRPKVPKANARKLLGI